MSRGFQYKDIVLTGRFDKPIETVKRLIRIGRGRVHSRLQKGVDMLIVGSNPVRRVMDDAFRMGIPLVDAKDLYDEFRFLNEKRPEQTRPGDKVRSAKLYAFSPSVYDYPKSTIIRALRRNGDHVIKNIDAADFLVTNDATSSPLQDTISIHDLARRLGVNLPSVAWIKRNDIALKKERMEDSRIRRQVRALNGISSPSPTRSNNRVRSASRYNATATPSRRGTATRSVRGLLPLRSTGQNQQ
ncbi:MAG: BRCT domain-containing protein [Candidatus Paceibacterota bacterium]|jgi:hypothetical protein